MHPIERAWVATGPYGAPNYDEFADCDEVRAAAVARPSSIVAVDNPQCFESGLAGAVAGLAAAKAGGRYRQTSGLFRYEFGTARAVVGLVSTADISSGPAEPGRVWRNEEVFADKVIERRAHLEALHTLISPVLLVPADPTALAELLADRPCDEPLVTETDERGVAHRLWPLAADAATLDAGNYLVADGNHRSLAAQEAGLGAALVVVADPAGLVIEPYHRLLRLEISGAELIERAAVLDPTPVQRADPAASHLYANGQLFRLGLPETGDPVARLPHTVVERRLIEGALQLDPAAVTYVGGAGVESALMSEVDAGRATGALLMRPVTTQEFVAVNAAREAMPRKSTWFTPKARSGLVLAELAAVRN